MMLGEFAIKDKENESDLELQASGRVCFQSWQWFFLDSEADCAVI